MEILGTYNWLYLVQSRVLRTNANVVPLKLHKCPQVIEQLRRLIFTAINDTFINYIRKANKHRFMLLHFYILLFSGGMESTPHQNLYYIVKYL